jgi:hypothetical protein
MIHLPPSYPPKHASESPPGAATTARLTVHEADPQLDRSTLLIFLLSTSISTFTISRVALHGSIILLALPPLSFAGTAAALWFRSRMMGGARLRGAAGLWDGTREEWLLAALVVASASMRIFEARLNHVTVWSAMEVSCVSGGGEAGALTFFSPDLSTLSSHRHILL